MHVPYIADNWRTMRWKKKSSNWHNLWYFRGFSYKLEMEKYAFLVRNLKNNVQSTRILLFI